MRVVKTKGHFPSSQVFANYPFWLLQVVRSFQDRTVTHDGTIQCCKYRENGAVFYAFTHPEHQLRIRITVGEDRRPVVILEHLDKPDQHHLKRPSWIGVGEPWVFESFDIETVSWLFADYFIRPSLYPLKPEYCWAVTDKIGRWRWGEDDRPVYYCGRITKISKNNPRELEIETAGAHDDGRDAFWSTHVRVEDLQGKRANPGDWLLYAKGRTPLVLDSHDVFRFCTVWTK